MSARSSLPAVPLALCLGASAAAAQSPQVVGTLTDPQYTVEFAFQPPADWPNDGAIRILFDQTEGGDGHALVLTARRCYLARTMGGEIHPFGREGAWQPTASPVHGVLQRRNSRIIALLNHVRVASAQDPAYHGGTVAWSATPDSLKLDDIHVQPVAPVEFTDDFVGEGGSPPAWEMAAGTWQTVGPKGESPRPDLSANPFSLRGAAGSDEQFALATAGDWFWDEYGVTVAAKAESAGALGVAAYVQDPANFLLFRWTSTGEAGAGEPAGRRQIIRVLDGQWTILAEAPGGFRTDRWYGLGLTACDGRLEAQIDGRPILTTRDTSFGQGRIGLFGQNIQGVSFDDAAAYSVREVTDDFSGGEPGWWAVATGEWQCRQDHLYGAIPKAAAAEATTGDADWRNYTVSALLKAKSAKAVGLTACRETDNRFYAFRWEANGRQTLEIVLDGARTVLAESTHPLDASRLYRAFLTVAHGRVAARVEGQPVLEAADTRLLQGPAGLRAEGPGEACFDDAAVTFDETRPPTFTVPAQFTREDTMQNWVDASRQWRRAEDGTLWYDMPLFGDFTVWLPEMDFAAVGGALDVLIAPTAPASVSTVLRLSTQAGSGAVTGRVAQEKVTLTEGAAEAPGLQRLRLVRRGTCLSAWLGDRPIVAWRDAAFAGRCLGLRLENLSLDLAETVVSSPNLVDVTFSGAPVDWAPDLGVWEVTDRWPCAPGWSWFGGSRHESPLLWSKDTLQGDQVLEFWAALLMDLPKEPGYSHPSDLNAILCGDGANLCSGYSFILAGDNNTRSKVLKGNTVVADNPNVKFENPVSMNLAFQRHWFDIRLEKIGNHLTYSVDGTLVAQWDDPDVLPGGKVGFWSFQNNGLLLARARMAAEKVSR
ncbi:MAG: hypothetical protein FJX75_23695 [Armatimonadetes bacterium]|nr:hypothetical protein [Armatimonadota bacterium]